MDQMSNNSLKKVLPVTVTTVSGLSSGGSQDFPPLPDSNSNIHLSMSRQHRSLTFGEAIKSIQSQSQDSMLTNSNSQTMTWKSQQQSITKTMSNLTNQDNLEQSGSEIIGIESDNNLQLDSDPGLRTQQSSENQQQHQQLPLVTVGLRVNQQDEYRSIMPNQIPKFFLRYARSDGYLFRSKWISQYGSKVFICSSLVLILLGFSKEMFLPSEEYRNSKSYPKNCDTVAINSALNQIIQFLCATICAIIIFNELYLPIFFIILRECWDHWLLLAVLLRLYIAIILEIQSCEPYHNKPITQLQNAMIIILSIYWGLLYSFLLGFFDAFQTELRNKLIAVGAALTVVSFDFIQRTINLVKNQAEYRGVLDDKMNNDIGELIKQSQLFQTEKTYQQSQSDLTEQLIQLQSTWNSSFADYESNNPSTWLWVFPMNYTENVLASQSLLIIYAIGNGLLFWRGEDFVLIKCRVALEIRDRRLNSENSENSSENQINMNRDDNVNQIQNHNDNHNDHNETNVNTNRVSSPISLVSKVPSPRETVATYNHLMSISGSLGSGVGVGEVNTRINGNSRKTVDEFNKNRKAMRGSTVSSVHK